MHGFVILVAKVLLSVVEFEVIILGIIGMEMVVLVKHRV
jgi:hypothetical protein